MNTDDNETPIHKDVGNKVSRSQLPITGVEYEEFYKALEDINKKTTVSVDELRKILKNARY